MEPKLYLETHPPPKEFDEESTGSVVRLDVLPGFAFRLKDLEAMTDFEDLVKDPVYQPYVQLNVQEQRKAKEEAEQAKEEAELRESQERHARGQAEQREALANQEILFLKAELERMKKG